VTWRLYSHSPKGSAVCSWVIIGVWQQTQKLLVKESKGMICPQLALSATTSLVNHWAVNW